MAESLQTEQKFSSFTLKSIMRLNRLMGRFSDVVWLFGEGRSGTTWLSNLLNYNDRYREMFEPFHPRYVKHASQWPYHFYLAPGTDDEAFERFSRKVFSGRLITRRVDMDNHGYFYDGLLIKDIFANLYAAWVADRFPGIKKVFLIRNPFAVALSKYNKRNWHWLEEPSQLLAQQSLHHDHLKPFEDLILGVGDDYIERQVLIWAILHYVPLAQLDLDQVHVVFYEHLYADPESELGALFHYLQRPEAGEENPGYLDAVNRPSWVSGSSSNIILGRSPISQWRKELSSRQIDRGREILERFGLDGLYAGDDLPNKAFLRDRLLNPASPM
jgi:hypothetical protein